jgi:molybdate transport system ATP-binding protein
LEVSIRQAGAVPLDVTFSCGLGKTLALIGPSGAGKSTILRTIAGLHHGAHGRIACDGEVWLDSQAHVDRPPHERHVGLVFQSYALFPHLSARGNVEIALGHLPGGARRAAADALLARANLAGLEGRKPAELSGGEQQRVAVARALARDPRVLLLDEPFSAIDRRTRRRLQADLIGLRQDVRAPIILVTHDLDEAMGLADEVVVLDRGRILQQGLVRDVVGAPASDEIRAILDQ